MQRIDASCLPYEKVHIFGKEMYFTDWRIDRETVPEDLFVYEVRHLDDSMFAPAVISEYIWVNYFGSLISKELIIDWDIERNGRHFKYIEYDGIAPKKSHWQYSKEQVFSLFEIVNSKAA